jgi:DNA-directed RNA polymerase subunit RPC12/RpoP
MSSEQIICPDCNGVIGAEAGSGVKACTCAMDRHYAPSAAQVAAAQAKQQREAAAATVVEKICRLCGTNLSGQRRLKDSDGYLCVPCAEKLHESKKAGMVACGECGRMLKPAGLIDYHGVKICKRCFADHQELDKFKAPPPKIVGADEAEKRRLKIWLAIAGVLAIILVLSRLGWI